MGFGLRRIVVVALLIVLLAGFVTFFIWSSVVPGGGAYSLEMIPVDPTSKVENVSAYPYRESIPTKEVASDSSMSYRGQSISSVGEAPDIVGSEQSPNTGNDSTIGPTTNRTDKRLALSSGDFLTIPRRSELTFRYGNKLEPSYALNARAFRVGEEELLYGENAELLELWSDLEDPFRPSKIPVSQPEVTGQEKMHVTIDLPTGVYVLSVSVSIPEGGARYIVVE